MLNIEKILMQDDTPICAAGDRWVGPRAIRCLSKGPDKFIVQASVIAGLNQRLTCDFSEAIGPFPSEAEACSRLAWLNHYLVICEKCADLLRNAIRKLEATP